MLDRKDMHILDLLQQNARLSNKEIAAAVDMAQSSAHERLKRLTKQGYFKGFYADLDLRKLGFNLEVMVAIKITNHSRQTIDLFYQDIAALPGLIQLYQVTGNSDFLLHFAVRDADDLRALILDKLSTLPYIQHLETTTIFHGERRSNITLPRQ